MNPLVELNLTLILFLPWFAILAAVLAVRASRAARARVTISYAGAVGGRVPWASLGDRERRWLWQALAADPRDGGGYARRAVAFGCVLFRGR